MMGRYIGGGGRSLALQEVRGAPPPVGAGVSPAVSPNVFVADTWADNLFGRPMGEPGALPGEERGDREVPPNVFSLHRLGGMEG
jgi:hypothetical protein